MTKYLASSTIGVQIFMLVSILATLFGLMYFPITINMLLVILLGYFVYGCLGIVVTYHRGLTHGSYKMRPWLTKLFTVFGALGNTGSAIAWVAIHINHHLKSDSIEDPHAPKYKGWKIFLLEYEADISKDTKWRMRHLITDKFQQVVHRYYFLILISWSLLLYMVGGLWLVIFGHLAPAFITGIMSNVVNIVGHKPNWFGGFRTYKLNDESTNNWLWAIPSWGEAWHNNHHRFPRRSKFSEKWYQPDIAAGVIRLIKA